MTTNELLLAAAVMNDKDGYIDWSRVIAEVRGGNKRAERYLRSCVDSFFARPAKSNAYDEDGVCAGYGCDAIIIS